MYMLKISTGSSAYVVLEFNYLDEYMETIKRLFNSNTPFKIELWRE